MSRGADSSRWIMEIKLCVCLVIKSNALTVALSPGPPAQVVFPYLSCTGRLPGHAVLIGAGASPVSCRKLQGKEPRDVTLKPDLIGLVLPGVNHEFVFMLKIKGDFNLKSPLYALFSNSSV